MLAGKADGITAARILTTADEQTAALAAAVQAAPRAIPRGAGTKFRPLPQGAPPAPGPAVIDVSGLRGILEYEPTEYTFTALAGTPISEVISALSAHGQYLPFDPLFVREGATLGGTVACAANGPGRLRFGGVRDFVVGVRFIDAAGRLIRGGGKVVKNAAGFDFPKLFCGSAGRLGILTELSFKVFPAPAARASIRVHCARLADAVECVSFISLQTWEVEALEILPQADGSAQVLARFPGDEPALSQRLTKITTALRRDVSAAPAEVWDSLRPRSPTHSLLRVPLTSSRILPLHALLPDVTVSYGEAGNAAWIQWPADRAASEMDAILRAAGLSAMVLSGPEPALRLGISPNEAAERLVKQALDPDGRFPPY